MNFCPNCGMQLQNNEKFCPNCGYSQQSAQAQEAPLEPDWEQGAERLRNGVQVPQQAAYQQQYVASQYQQPQNQPQYQTQYQQQYPYQQPQKDRSICTVIKIFLILGCVAYGWLIIPLAWTLPITISICNKMKNNEPVGTGLKVCALLFVNLIAGICLLASDDV